jgi:hypothetical protein
LVDVAEEEEVDGAIPVAGELVPGDAVPPGVVEATIGEVGELGEEVEEGFPDEVPGELRVLA